MPALPVNVFVILSRPRSQLSSPGPSLFFSRYRTLMLFTKHNFRLQAVSKPSSVLRTLRIENERESNDR